MLLETPVEEKNIKTVVHCEILYVVPSKTYMLIAFSA